MSSAAGLSGGVRTALPSDRRTIAVCLSRAFEDDPISCFIFPQRRNRVSRLVSFYRGVIRLMAPYGAIYTDAAVRGAAIWRSPTPLRVSRLRATRDGLEMLATLRSSVGRAMMLEQVAGPARPRVPHWYLAILGTDPRDQGRGIGSALLAPVLERCDEEQLPAYLESSKQTNIPFYERHGFRVSGELKIPNGPCLWSMIRDPETR